MPHDEIVSEKDGFLILEAVYQPSTSTIWRTVPDVNEIEALLLEQNKRHLQQKTSIEEDGRVRSLMTDHDTDRMQEVLDGTISIPEATDEVIAAWITSVKQTDAEHALPPIKGEI